MLRRLNILLSLISLLLCLSLLCLWPRTYRQCPQFVLARDMIDHDFAGTIYAWKLSLQSYDGMILLRASWQRDGDVYQKGWTWTYTTFSSQIMRAINSRRPPFAGFAFRAQSSSLGIAVPLWLPILLAALLPARHLFAIFRHRRRLRLGLCPTCAYDLRASTANCPECGSPIPQRTANPPPSQEEAG